MMHYQMNAAYGRSVRPRSRVGPPLIMILLAVALGAGLVFASGRTLWQDGGVQLCGSSAGTILRATSDGAGGAMVVWLDTRDLYENVYAQHVNADGVPLWTPNGALLGYHTSGGPQGAVSDGEGGAIVAFGATSLSVQRVSADGEPLWGAQGVELWRVSGDGSCYASLLSDGHGGAIIAWTSRQLGCPDTLAACRIDSSGGTVWRTCIRTESLGWTPPMCPDSLGGVIVGWEEYRASPWTVRVQRLDSAGTVKWGPAGVRACTLATSQLSPRCLAAGESSIVVGWVDRGVDTSQHRAQMFNITGDRLWSASGAPISGVLSSNTGGFGSPTGDARRSVWVWSEVRAGTEDYFAQKLDSTGARCWDSGGIWLGTSDTSEGRSFGLTSDGRGGVIAAWPLYRNPSNWDLYGQHVDSAGHQCWSDTGLAVCRDSYIQKWTPRVVADGEGGAIVFWGDVRGIFAQRLADGAGIEEAMSDERRTLSNVQTVVRGMLLLPEEATSPKAQDAGLLNVCGVKVAELHGGANDVSRLASGVYFVREAKAHAPAQFVRKVVIAR